MKPESRYSCSCGHSHYDKHYHNKSHKWNFLMVGLGVFVCLVVVSLIASIFMLRSVIYDDNHKQSVYGMTSGEMIERYGDTVRYTDPFGFQDGCDEWMITHDNQVIYCVDDLDESHELVLGGKPFDPEETLFSIPTLEWEVVELLDASMNQGA